MSPAISVPDNYTDTAISNQTVIVGFAIMYKDTSII